MTAHEHFTVTPRYYQEDLSSDVPGLEGAMFVDVQPPFAAYDGMSEELRSVMVDNADRSEVDELEIHPFDSPDTKIQAMLGTSALISFRLDVRPGGYVFEEIFLDQFASAIGRILRDCGATVTIVPYAQVKAAREQAQ